MAKKVSNSNFTNFHINILNFRMEDLVKKPEKVPIMNKSNKPQTTSKNKKITQQPQQQQQSQISSKSTTPRSAGSMNLEGENNEGDESKDTVDAGTENFDEENMKNEDVNNIIPETIIENEVNQNEAESFDNVVDDEEEEDVNLFIYLSRYVIIIIIYSISFLSQNLLPDLNQDTNKTLTNSHFLFQDDHLNKPTHYTIVENSYSQDLMNLQIE